MDTISNEARERRRQRKHSDEFKAQAVAACRQPGISIAAGAMSNGVNANLLRRWVIEAEQATGDTAVTLRPACKASPNANSAPSFVPLQMASAAAEPSTIRIELRRDGTAITVAWPASAAAECAAWMRELLR